MGKIVGGFGVPHVLFPPNGVEEQADRVLDGFIDIRDKIAALEPDLLLIASNDHLNNFNLKLQVPFIVGIADEYVPLGDMGIPQTPYRGHRDFAHSFVCFAAGEGFDLAQAEEIRPDHGMAVPMTFLNTDASIPIVPLYINVGIEPPVSPARAWQLGETLRKMVETARPAGEKVAIIAAGGLSHWLCDPQEGRVNEAFDTDFIEKLISGRGEELSKLQSEEILEQAGNGGLEMTNWVFMAGCLPGATGEKVFYEPMPEWITGMGAVALEGV